MYPGWQPVQNTYMPQYQIVHMQGQPGWSAPIPRQPMMAGLPPAPLPQGIPPPRVEDNPPLPPEPPPADDKSEIELKPKDSLEELKLQELKNKAAQWQQTLQLQQQQTLQLQQQQTLQLQQQQTLQLQQQQTLQLQQQQTLQLQQQWPGAPPPMLGFQTPLDFIKKEEEDFNVQYDQWKKQYDEWREQNKSHPNKEQYNLYLQQWQTYERQMEDKKADILRRKEEAKRQMKEQEKAAAKGPSYAMPNPALMGMIPGSNFLGPPPPFGPPPPPHNFGSPPFVPRAPYGPGPPVPVGPQGSMGGMPPVPGLPVHHMHDPNAPLPGFSPHVDSKPQGPVNEADKTFNDGDQEGAVRGSVQSTDGIGGTVGGSGKEVPVGGGQKGSSESTDHPNENSNAPEGKPVGNLQLLEDLLNSNNVQVNKILLRQITDDSKKVLSRLDEEGREFLTAFGTMNPAQLNRLIRVINSMGEQQKVLEDLGGLTPQILNRMKREVKDEMTKMQGNVSGIIAGRSQGSGNDAGRGRGNDMGMGRGTEMGRGRGTEMGRGRGTEMGRGRGTEMGIGMENTDMDLRQGNDVNQVTGGDTKTGTEMDFGQRNEIGMGWANNRGRGMGNDLGRGRGYDIGRGRGSGDGIHRRNDTELDLGDQMCTEMDIEDENDMEFGQVDENFYWGRNLGGMGRGNAMGRGKGDMRIEMESNLELGFGNDMGIARGRGHDMSRGRGSDLSIGSGNMDFGLGNDMEIGRGRGNYMGRGSDVGRGRGNDMGRGRGNDMGRGRGNDMGMGRGNDMGRGSDVGRGRGNDMGRRGRNDMGMGGGSDMGRGRVNDMGMGRDLGMGYGMEFDLENDKTMGRGRGNDMGRGRGSDVLMGRGSDMGRGRGSDMGRGRGSDMSRGRGNDMSMGRGNDLELWLGDEMDVGRGRDIGRGSANVMGTDRLSDLARGRGNDMARGRGNDMARGRGNDMVRGRGNDMVRGRGNVMARGRGNDMARGRGNDMARGRGNDMARGRGNDMARGRGNDMARGRGNDMARGRGGIFGRGRGVDNQGNWFAGSDQFEDVTCDESQQDFGPDSFDDNYQEPPPMGLPKGPVSLLDLNIDKPFSGNKPDGQKTEQNKKQNVTLQTFGQQPVMPGGMLGLGGPGARPRMPVRYPGPGGMKPPGMVRPAGMRHPRMMGSRGMMTGPNTGPCPLIDNIPGNEPDMFQGEVFESFREDENSQSPSFEFVSPQSSIRANTSADSSTTTLAAAGPAQSNDKTDIKPTSTALDPKPLGQESPAANENQRTSKGPGFQQDLSQRMNQSKSQEKRPEPPDQVLGGQFNQQPFKRPPQQMQHPQQPPKPLGQFQQQQMQGGQFFDASKQQQERDRNQRGRWGQERELSLDSDMGNFRDQGRGRGFNRGQDIAGDRFGRDRSSERAPFHESNEPWRRGPPHVQHRQWNQEQLYDYDPQFQEDQGDNYGDEYGAREAKNYPEEGHGYPEPGFEDERGFGASEAEVGETEYLEEAHTFRYRPEVTPRFETNAGRFGEQFREPERFPPDDRFGAQEQPHDPYRQPDDQQYSRLPFRDPYERSAPYRIDPYDRPDPYRDSYDPYARRPPLDDSYRPGFDDPFNPYRPPIEDRDPFRVPETIDYGHMPTALLRGEEDRGFQAPAVIEYGHGQGIDQQDPGFSSRLPSNVPAPEDDRRDVFREQVPLPADRNFPSSFVRGTPAGPPTTLSSGPPPSKAEPKIEVVKIEDLLNSPGRNSRPAQIVVIVRGLPGSGKSYVSKLLKDKEVSKGGGAPRMLCLDDYFMIEVDKVDKDPESGKRIKKKVLEYEYEAEMESAYRQNMLKSFKKTIDDGFFPFIIVDAVFDRIKHFEEFWSYAKSKGFQVYVVELQCDVATCAKRNTHKRTQKEIEKIQHKWEETPVHYIKLDIRSLLQDDSITEVEMEDSVSDQAPPLPPQPAEPKAEEEEEEEHLKKSKWELDLSEGNLDKLDGLQHSKKKHTDTESSQSSMEEFLQLADEYFARQIQEPGKKRVRWADLEERKNSAYRRDLGFVVGQTHEDWQRITDPHYAERQLNKTKYF